MFKVNNKDIGMTSSKCQLPCAKNWSSLIFSYPQSIWNHCQIGWNLLKSLNIENILLNWAKILNAPWVRSMESFTSFGKNIKGDQFITHAYSAFTWHCSGVFIVNFEQILQIVLVFPLQRFLPVIVASIPDETFLWKNMGMSVWISDW